MALGKKLKYNLSGCVYLLVSKFSKVQVIES